MTTLYKPVLIETAEQAEALPARTLIGTGGLSGSWITLTYPEDADWGADDLPFRALVPIEAEEEMDTDYYMGGDGSPMRRYVTPWVSV